MNFQDNLPPGVTLRDIEGPQRDDEQHCCRECDAPVELTRGGNVPWLCEMCAERGGG